MKLEIPPGEYVLRLEYNAKRISHLVVSIIGILLTLTLLVISKWKRN